MSKRRDLKYNEVVKGLTLIGFRFYRQGRGSHELWVRDSDALVIPVPRHQGKTIRKGTLRAIIRQTGLGVKEFMELS